MRGAAGRIARAPDTPSPPSPRAGGPAQAGQYDGLTVKLRILELRRARLPLVTAFHTALGTEQVREMLLVRAECDEAEGWGECVAGSQPSYSSEYIDSAWLTLERCLAPALLGAGELDGTGVQSLLRRFKGHRMAKAALEMAILDAELRSAGVSLRSFLGGVADSVTAGVAVGIAGSIDELLDSVGGYLAAGYRRVKLKIEPGWDLQPVQAVRERFGDDLMLQADANGSYGRSDFEHLAQLDQFSLLLLEQPLREEDLLGHAQLARRIATPVCLDESIVSADSAATALALGACSVVNIKPGRVGGLLEARAVHDLCLGHSVPVWCGGMLETGVGRAANLALASLPGFTLPGDISASDRYFSEDITAPFVLHDGKITVPDGPGLGVEVRLSVLEGLTTQVETIRPGDK
jgi:O-succinylbenzoate synthase